MRGGYPRTKGVWLLHPKPSAQTMRTFPWYLRVAPHLLAGTPSCHTFLCFMHLRAHERPQRVLVLLCPGAGTAQDVLAQRGTALCSQALQSTLPDLEAPGRWCGGERTVDSRSLPRDHSAWCFLFVCFLMPFLMLLMPLRCENSQTPAGPHRCPALPLDLMHTPRPPAAWWWGSLLGQDPGQALRQQGP